jgi:hypothetical protein
MHSHAQQQERMERQEVSRGVQQLATEEQHAHRFAACIPTMQPGTAGRVMEG